MFGAYPLRVPPCSKTYATVSDTNLPNAYLTLTQAVSGGNTSGTKPTYARRIRVGTAGALSVIYANGVADTIPALRDGECIEGEFASLVASGTTATNVTVFW